MKKELKERIHEYINKKPTRMHMPGHKGRINDFYMKDLTELSFNDNLLSPNDVILNLQNKIADIFNTKYSFILVNGSTGGIISSILYSLNKDEKILIPRNSHISSYYGLYLSEASPIYIYPKDNNIGISEEEYIEAVEKNKDIKAVFITYPSYFGYCLDIKNLCRKIKEINSEIIIIVDEAHGTHFSFNKEYPSSALEAKSDIVITSMHKTLTSLTQTSLLHVNSDIIDIERLKLFFKMTTSTSPSFLFLQSVEEAVSFADEKGEQILNKIKEWYFEIKNDIEEKTDFYLEEFGSDVHDYTKLCINVDRTNLDGYTLAEILENEYNIFTECSTEKYVLVYLGLLSKKEDLNILLNALIDICKIDNLRIQRKIDIIFGNNKPIIKYSMRNTLKLKKERVLIDDSVGLVSYDFIVPYPPGYPILTPGEIINKDIIDYINSIKNKQTILGIEEDGLNVVKE